eukprot:352088-Chlamydomonas_euryale.AAC.24
MVYIAMTGQIGAEERRSLRRLPPLWQRCGSGAKRQRSSEEPGIPLQNIGQHDLVFLTRVSNPRAPPLHTQVTSSHTGHQLTHRSPAHTQVTSSLGPLGAHPSNIARRANFSQSSTWFKAYVLTERARAPPPPLLRPRSLHADVAQQAGASSAVAHNLRGQVDAADARAEGLAWELARAEAAVRQLCDAKAQGDEERQELEQKVCTTNAGRGRQGGMTEGRGGLRSMVSVFGHARVGTVVSPASRIDLPAEWMCQQNGCGNKTHWSAEATR